MKLKSLIIGISIFFILSFFANKAYAYLAPGAGSYMFQIIIATVISGLFAVKLFWTKIVGFFKKLFLKSKNNE